ncbi:LysR family transcriptional regulator [Pseudonocardia acaciae]|uniref:LysR family transcriptional regulator n=1 Tax=Pseudonocardia acaciae TaxID=551276 RepID=UPI000A00BFD3|nr:LysR family transcriptional regulator [Pseudonocardia acaciae]
MAMTLQQLQYFLTAVRRKSFSAAAEEMHIAQPSLSEQIRRLERQLGVTLFVRTNRELQLTDAGRILVPHAERTLAESRAAAEAVREVRTLTGGTVSFGTFSSAHLYLLPALIADFHRRYPGVVMHIIGLNSAEVATEVREGRLEAGLVMLPVDARGLAVTPPVMTDSVVYVSADPQRVRRPVTIHDIAAGPLIMSDSRWEDDPLRREIATRAQRAGVTLTPIAEVELQVAAAELAARGVGDTFVSWHVASSRGYLRRLGWAPLDPPYTETFGFVTRRNTPLSPATRRFMELAGKHLARLQRRRRGQPR